MHDANNAHTGQTKVKTTLYERHKAMGAKMADFHGFVLPIRYTQEAKEHANVRENIGVFDVSHMGEIIVTGPGALAYLEKLQPNNLSALKIGKCQYTVLCREDGTAVDDIIIYRRGEQDFFICVNASNADKDYAFMQSYKSTGVNLHNASAEYDQLAVQGPKAEALLADLFGSPVVGLKPFSFLDVNLDGMPIIYSTTGYTGERGAELYCRPDHTERLWDLLFQRGEIYGIGPAGLAARDTLRLEMGYMLFGNDLLDDTTPIEAGLNWVVKFQKLDFHGRDTMLAQSEGALKRRLRGIVLDEKGIPRTGYAVTNAAGKSLGAVTSGTISPTLGTPIAMAYLSTDTDLTEPVFVQIRTSHVRGHIVQPPFVTLKRS